MSVFQTANVFEKMNHVEDECHRLLCGQYAPVPLSPARDIEIRKPYELPGKMGLKDSRGQARLLHDLANIELQAMELGLRTLHEYPDAPKEFREQLVNVVLDEARHLKLCLEGLQQLGFEWGHWPVHLLLWNTVDCEDSLLDRILIVHRYLEGSGLDSSDALLRKLSGVSNKMPRQIVKVIATEEMGHVQFGSRWYKEICKSESLNSDFDFDERMNKLFHRLPARGARVAEAVRLEAGFSHSEIRYMNEMQKQRIEANA